MVMLLVAATILAIGLLVAAPVWQTQIRRESEEELIFRGKQYAEAVRVYQLKNPGRFPQTLKELYDKRFLRRLFPDPMTKSGKWDVILQSSATVPQGGLRPGVAPGVPPGAAGKQSILVAPEASLGSISNPRILGVVSSSTQKSVRLYNDQDSYDKWLFYYGQDPKSNPEITYYGRPEKK